MKYLILFFTLFISCVLYSQEKISIGIEGGINIPGLVERSSNPVVNGFKTKLSPYFGMSVEVGLNKKWSLLQEVDYGNTTITKTGKQVIPRSTYENLGLADLLSYPHLYATFDSKIQITYIEIPTMFKYYIYQNDKVNFFVKGGPFVGILIYGNASTSGKGQIYSDDAHTKPVNQLFFKLSQSENLIDLLNPLNFGLRAGFGLTLKGNTGDLFIGANSSVGLVNLEDKSGDFDGKTRSLVLSLGYMYHLSK